MTIDEYLTHHRLKAKELAKAAGLRPADISRVRKGKRPPSARILQGLFTATDGKITPNDFSLVSGDRKAA